MLEKERRKYRDKMDASTKAKALVSGRYNDKKSEDKYWKQKFHNQDTSNKELGRFYNKIKNKEALYLYND